MSAKPSSGRTIVDTNSRSHELRSHFARERITVCDQLFKDDQCARRKDYIMWRDGWPEGCSSFTDVRQSAWRLRIFMAGPARHAIPALELHARSVGCFRPMLIEFFDRRVVVGKLLDEKWHAIYHMCPHRQMKVGQSLRDMAILAPWICTE